MEFVEVIPEPGPGEDRSDDDVAKRMADEAVERGSAPVSASAMASCGEEQCQELRGLSVLRRTGHRETGKTTGLPVPPQQGSKLLSRSER